MSEASSGGKKRRGARYAIEFRTRSRRTESGWTKWQHYIVIERAEDADRAIESLADWCHEYQGELRIVDREVAR